MIFIMRSFFFLHKNKKTKKRKTQQLFFEKISKSNSGLLSIARRDVLENEENLQRIRRKSFRKRKKKSLP